MSAQPSRTPPLIFVFLVVGCGAATPRTAERPRALDDEQAVAHILDLWHEAAAASDEERYFALLSSDAIFLGTDQSERWDVAAFRAYAHRPFSEGRGWRMHAIRRQVVVRSDFAWFDEDLETANLGPARGSGVLQRNAAGEWRIHQYNLAITVPNERFDDVRRVLTTP